MSKISVLIFLFAVRVMLLVSITVLDNELVWLYWRQTLASESRNKLVDPTAENEVALPLLVN